MEMDKEIQQHTADNPEDKAELSAEKIDNPEDKAELSAEKIDNPEDKAELSEEKTELPQNEAAKEAIIEAILFTMGESVSLEKIAAALELSQEETKQLLEGMMVRYEREDRGICLIELDGSYQMCTKKQMYEYLIKIAKQPKKQLLTDVLLETLSIIAYKQPVTKLEIEKIRGVSSGHAVSKLIDYNLVCELGRLDAPGRPLLFGTTEEFLRSFGVQSIDELPQPEPEKVEEFRQEAEEEMEIRMKL